MAVPKACAARIRDLVLCVEDEKDARRFARELGGAA